MARVEVPWFASPPMVNCARSGFVTQGRGSLGLACHCLSWARGEFCVALQTLRAPLCTRPRRRVCAKSFVAHVRENGDIQAVVSGLACRLGRDSASTSGMQDACQPSPLAHGLRTRSGAQQKLLVGDGAGLGNGVENLRSCLPVNTVHSRVYLRLLGSLKTWPGPSIVQAFSEEVDFGN